MRIRQTNKSGNRAGTTSRPAFIDAGLVAVKRRVTSKGTPTEAARAVCPVCGLEVAIRASDGQLRSHRVGSTPRSSWPCPGAVAAGRSCVLTKDELAELDAPVEQ